jgi:hypothetical protein
VLWLVVSENEALLLCLFSLIGRFNEAALLFCLMHHAFWGL